MIRPSTTVTHSPDKGFERGDDWRQAAACAHDDNPSAWDPEATPADRAHAMTVCLNDCPVIDQCDALARRLRPEGGVWAGRNIPERSHKKGQPA